MINLNEATLEAASQAAYEQNPAFKGRASILRRLTWDKVACDDKWYWRDKTRAAITAYFEALEKESPR